MSVAVALTLWLDECVWAIVASLAIGAFVSLWVSRRVAGPYYRIERDLEAFLSGAIEGKTIRLRPGDPMQRLADLINVLIERSRSTT